MRGFLSQMAPGAAGPAVGKMAPGTGGLSSEKGVPGQLNIPGWRVDPQVKKQMEAEFGPGIMDAVRHDALRNATNAARGAANPDERDHFQQVRRNLASDNFNVGYDPAPKNPEGLARFSGRVGKPGFNPLQMYLTPLGMQSAVERGKGAPHRAVADLSNSAGHEAGHGVSRDYGGEERVQRIMGDEPVSPFSSDWGTHNNEEEMNYGLARVRAGLPSNSWRKATGHSIPYIMSSYRRR